MGETANPNVLKRIVRWECDACQHQPDGNTFEDEQESISLDFGSRSDGDNDVVARFWDSRRYFGANPEGVWRPDAGANT